MIELPGKEVGKVKVNTIAGDTPETEYSIVDLVSGNIDTSNLNNYYIQEEKK